MIITTALANEIVARAMAIIHHNVNVIDHHGQIIASGERHRIGEQHEVAREVIPPVNAFVLTIPRKRRVFRMCIPVLITPLSMTIAW